MTTSKGALRRQLVQSCDWTALRRAFVERPERPLLADLSAEFGVSVDRIGRACTDQGWPTLRAAHMGERLKQSDAGLAILRAAKADGAITSAVTNSALEIIREVDGVVQSLGTRKVAPNTKANTLNTCGFVLSNLANALARVGVVGLPKSLKESAGVDSGNGRWNPAMLQALNITVQTIVRQQQAPAKVVLATDQEAPPVAIPATLEAATEPVDVPAMAEPELAASDVL
jgi:hypothetical protein